MANKFVNVQNLKPPKEYAGRMGKIESLQAVSRIFFQGRYKVQPRVFREETSKFKLQHLPEILCRMKTELQTFDRCTMGGAQMLHNYIILLMYATVALVSLMHRKLPNITENDQQEKVRETAGKARRREQFRIPTQNFESDKKHEKPDPFEFFKQELHCIAEDTTPTIDRDLQSDDNNGANVAVSLSKGESETSSK